MLQINCMPGRKQHVNRKSQMFDERGRRQERGNVPRDTPKKRSSYRKYLAQARQKSHDRSV
jgi:hypothetical protein